MSEDIPDPRYVAHACPTCGYVHLPREPKPQERSPRVVVKYKPEEQVR